MATKIQVYGEKKPSGTRPDGFIMCRQVGPPDYWSTIYDHRLVFLFGSQQLIVFLLRAHDDALVIT